MLRIIVRLERWRRHYALQDFIASTHQPEWRAMLGIIAQQDHFPKQNAWLAHIAAILPRH
jgi:hypothetical protein